MQLNIRSKVPKVNKRVRDRPCFHCWVSHKRIKVHNYNIYAEGLKSVSHNLSGWMFSFCEPLWAHHSWLFEFLLVSSTVPVPTILPPLFCRILQTLHNVWLWVCICLHQLLDKASLMKIGHKSGHRCWVSSGSIFTFTRSRSWSHSCRFLDFLALHFYLTPKCSLLSSSLFQYYPRWAHPNLSTHRPIPTHNQFTHKIFSFIYLLISFYWFLLIFYLFVDNFI